VSPPIVFLMMLSFGPMSSLVMVQVMSSPTWIVPEQFDKLGR
jgi:hypothetical protein